MSHDTTRLMQSLGHQSRCTHASQIAGVEADVHQSFLVSDQEILDQAFFFHLQLSGIVSHLFEHAADDRQVDLVGLDDLVAAAFEVGLEPLLAVVEVGVLVFDHALGDLAGEGISNRDIDVVSRDREGFDH